MKTWVKKTVSAVTAGVMALSVTAISAFAAVGDVNLSGNTNTADARLVLRYAAQLQELTPAQMAKADVTNDGRVNSADARLLLRAAAQLENLEFYENYYARMEADGMAVTIGSWNGNLYTEMDGAELLGDLGGEAKTFGILLGKDGSMTLVNQTDKSFCTMTASELANLSRMMGGDSFNVKEMMKDLTSGEDISIPTPMHLKDIGAVIEAAEYNGTAATKYTLDGATYYFAGSKILAVEDSSTTVVYKDFTTDAYSRIYAFRNGGYREYDDILVMMMSAIPDLSLLG